MGLEGGELAKKRGVQGEKGGGEKCRPQQGKK